MDGPMEELLSKFKYVVPWLRKMIAKTESFFQRSHRIFNAVWYGIDEHCFDREKVEVKVQSLRDFLWLSQRNPGVNVASSTYWMLNFVVMLYCGLHWQIFFRMNPALVFQVSLIFIGYMNSCMPQFGSLRAFFYGTVFLLPIYLARTPRRFIDNEHLSLPFLLLSGTVAYFLDAFLSSAYSSFHIFIISAFSTAGLSIWMRKYIIQLMLLQGMDDLTIRSFF